MVACKGLSKGRAHERLRDIGSAIHLSASGSGLPRLMRENARWLRLHQIRHAYLIYLAMEGIPVKAVSERVGHTSASVTEDNYGHVLPDIQGRAAEADGRFLREVRNACD